MLRTRYFLAPWTAMRIIASNPWTAMRLIASKLKYALPIGIQYFLAFPPLAAMRIIASMLKLRKSQSGELVEFPVSDRVCPALRAKTHDIDIFEQIFLLRDCEVKLQTEPRFIIDAGAHTGCSALFFASCFPREYRRDRGRSGQLSIAFTEHAQPSVHSRCSCGSVA